MNIVCFTFYCNFKVVYPNNTVGLDSNIRREHHVLQFISSVKITGVCGAVQVLYQYDFLNN